VAATPRESAHAHAAWEDGAVAAVDEWLAALERV
jgi:hypothetical protein